MSSGGGVIMSVHKNIGCPICPFLRTQLKLIILNLKIFCIAVRARRERGRATCVENSFSQKRQNDDGRAARSRLVAIKQFGLQAPQPPPSLINWHEPVGVHRLFLRRVFSQK